MDSIWSYGRIPPIANLSAQAEESERRLCQVRRGKARHIPGLQGTVKLEYKMLAFWPEPLAPILEHMVFLCCLEIILG